MLLGLDLLSDYCDGLYTLRAKHRVDSKLQKPLLVRTCNKVSAIEILGTVYKKGSWLVTGSKK